MLVARLNIKMVGHKQGFLKLFLLILSIGAHFQKKS